MGPESICLSVRSNGREGSYRFTCPSCADDVEKRADRKIVALLVSAGVDIDGTGTAHRIRSSSTTWAARYGAISAHRSRSTT